MDTIDQRENLQIWSLQNIVSACKTAVILPAFATRIATIRVPTLTTTLTTVIVSSLLVITACSTTSIPLTKEDRDAIKTIYISKLIVRDARPALLRLDSFRGPRTGDFVKYYDANLPSPGYLEIYNNEKIYNRKLSEIFSSGNNSIDHVLYNSFVTEWEKRGLLPLTPSMEPDAVIKLELVNYGLVLGRGSSYSSDHGYAPYMMLRAYIVDSNNKIIWQEEAEYEQFLVGPQNRLRLQQWIARPERLEGAFQEVSYILSEAIVDVLAKNLDDDPYYDLNDPYYE